MDAQRRLAVLLLGLAGAAWLLVLVVGIAVDPLADPNSGFIGAIALGVATGVTAAPLFWLISYARHRRIAYRGDWLRAGRRGAWVGILVGLANHQAGRPARMSVAARADARRTLIEILDGLPELRSFGAERQAAEQCGDRARYTRADIAAITSRRA